MRARANVLDFLICSQKDAYVLQNQRKSCAETTFQIVPRWRMEAQVSLDNLSGGQFGG